MDDGRFRLAFANAATNRSMNLIILPTEQCNFRCVYCYEDFQIGKMAPRTVTAVTRMLDRRIDDLDQLSINWFGGEPLLAADVIGEISLHILNLQASRPQLIFQAGMTTNGYRLDQRMLERMTSLNVRDFQISLDGPADTHDTTRRRINGSGSFDRIWANLLGIRESEADVHVMIRIHVTPENLPLMDGFVAVVRETFLKDRRFSVMLMPIAHLGGPNDEQFDVLPADATRSVLRRLSAVARGEDPDQNSGSSALEPASLAEEDVCYASKPNSIMIRANGTLGKCTVALQDPANQIGRLRDDGTMQIDNPRLQRWFQGWQTGVWSDLSCPRDAFFLGGDEPEACAGCQLAAPTVREHAFVPLTAL